MARASDHRERGLQGASVRAPCGRAGQPTGNAVVCLITWDSVVRPRVDRGIDTEGWNPPHAKPIVVLKLWFRHPHKFPSYVGSRIKGTSLGHKQNCRRVEAAKSTTRPSYSSARWNDLTEGRYSEGANNRSAAGRSARNEARRHHAGGQKAFVSGNEKTLGGTPKEGIMRPS
jgi:hypothetical protein